MSFDPSLRKASLRRATLCAYSPSGANRQSAHLDISLDTYIVPRNMWREKKREYPIKKARQTIIHTTIQVLANPSVAVSRHRRHHPVHRRRLSDNPVRQKEAAEPARVNYGRLRLGLLFLCLLLRPFLDFLFELSELQRREEESASVGGERNDDDGH